MKYPDIFEDEIIEDKLDIVDVSCDEGMWYFVSMWKKKIGVRWGYETGTKVNERTIRSEIKSSNKIYIYGAGSSGGEDIFTPSKKRDSRGRFH